MKLKEDSIVYNIKNGLYDYAILGMCQESDDIWIPDLPLEVKLLKYLLETILDGQTSDQFLKTQEEATLS
jgi:hypothetical protein